MPLQIHIKSGQHLWWGGPGRRLRQVTCEGQAHRLAVFRLDSPKKQKVLVATRMDGHILFASFCFSALGWSGWNSIQWIHHFNVCWQIQSPWLVGNSHAFHFVNSNSCPRRRPQHHPGFGQHGQSQPKASWTMELTIPSMDGRWKIWVKPLTS